MSGAEYNNGKPD